MASEMLSFDSGRPPRLADRYLMVATLDTAGIAHVYLAWDERSDQWVTVKVLSTKWVNDVRVRARFRNETETLRHVAHHGVLRVLAQDLEHPHMPYVVTEVAEGGTIGEWVAENGPMEPYLAIHVMAMLCSALDRAHLAGVEHGELGTEHLLIDRQGALKLNGFRGATSFGDSVDGFNDTADVAEILYFLLSGRSFDRTNLAKSLELIDPVLAPIVDKGTRRKRRGDRYASVMALSRDLEAAVLRLPIPESPVRVLCDEQSWLPDAWSACFDPSEVFDDLQTAKRMIDDPDFVPQAPKIDLYEQITKSQTHRDAGDDVPEVSEAQKYAIPEGPLYQEIEDRESEEWRRISAPAQPAEEVVAPAAMDMKGGDQTMELGILPRVALVGSLLVLLMLVVILGIGAHGVRTARQGFDAAAADLVKVVSDEGGVVYSLSAAGVDRGELEALYFAFDDAPKQKKREHALAFATFVVSEAKARGVESAKEGERADPTAMSVDRIGKKLLYYESQRASWAAAADGFPGILASTIGLAGRPD